VLLLWAGAGLGNLMHKMLSLTALARNFVRLRTAKRKRLFLLDFFVG
jgi:hypothetical protein